MMNTTGFGYGILTFWVLHWVFGTLWIIGAVLLLFWAIKHLAPEQLKTWALWLFAIGIIGAIVTAPASLAGWGLLMQSKGGRGMMGGGMMQKNQNIERLMDRMKQHDAGAGDGDHMEMNDMMRMMMQ